MEQRIMDYQEINENCLLIDVRSPGEYQDSTIEGAVNVPLFSDTERALVGTTYKQCSVGEAKRIGIEIVSQKLLTLYDQLEQYRQTKKRLVVFCARGGMRSGSLCALFNALHFPLWQLRGGYKSYRQMIYQQLPKVQEKVNYLVLHGYTGTGKTEILLKLKELGYAVLDLEGAANHRGSLFGAVGLGKSSSQKAFESHLYHQLLEQKSNLFFVEAESRKIGQVTLSDLLYNKMQNGLHILVDCPVAVRAERIVAEYIQGESCDDQILAALGKLKATLGGKLVQRLRELVQNNQYVEVAVQLINLYYDPLYRHKQQMHAYCLTVDSSDTAVAAIKIADWLNREKPLD